MALLLLTALLASTTWGGMLSTSTSWEAATSVSTAWGRVHSTLSSPPRKAYGLATRVTVGAPPSICTSNDYSYETKMSVPTGYVFIVPGGTQWGPDGSVWNISTGAGAKLINMTANCQGSECTNIAGKNKLHNGQMKQREDGSWYMNVTASMQTGLMISGLLVSDTGNQSDSHKHRQLHRRKETTYPLDITALPPCGLPVASNCTSRNFTVDHTQWEAYQVEKFMKSYLSKNNINSFDAFRAKAMEDFEPKMTANSKVCDITNPHFNCLAPQWSDCHDTDDDTVRGVIMTTAIVEYTNFIALIYGAVSTVRGRIGSDIDEIVANFWVPAATETWEKIMSVVSSILGILAAGFAILGLVLGPEVAWIGWLSSAAGAISAGFGTAGNIGNLKNPGDTNTEFEQSAKYEIGAQNLLSQVMNGIELLYSDDHTGQDNINTIIGGGAWVGSEISNTFNTQGWGADSTEWYEKLMVAQFISKALRDNDAYILFIPYGYDIEYNGKKLGFDQTTCEKHWKNDTSWKYHVSCDITFGPGGDSGMSLFTRPSSEGAESESWVNKPINYHGQNITGDDILGSSIWGQQAHGFDFTLLDQNFTNILATEGISAAAKTFKNVALDTPGLFNLPLCVVRDLAYVAGVDIVMSDINNSAGHGGYYHSGDPCPCADYTYTSAGGKTGKFTDFVSQKVRDSLGSDCSMQGHMRSPDDVNLNA